MRRKIWQRINKNLYEVTSRFSRAAHSTLWLNFPGILARILVRKGDFFVCLFHMGIFKKSHGLLETRLFHWHDMTFKIMKSIVICS